jgi:hypothetical protein
LDEIQEFSLETLESVKNAMGDNTPADKETKIDDKPKKPTRLLMEWPNALSALAEEDEDDLAEEARSLQQLLASVFDGLLI